jgi:hypothetical protein
MLVRHVVLLCFLFPVETKKTKTKNAMKMKPALKTTPPPRRNSLLNATDAHVMKALKDTIRVELAAVVDERCRREQCRPALVSDVRSAQRQTNNQIAEQMSTIAGQTNQIVVQTNQIAALNDTVSGQSSQIAELQRLARVLVEQNQQMQEQNREVHALLITRVEAQSVDGDKADDNRNRGGKRRRTGR